MDVSRAYAEWHEDLFSFLTSATRDRELAEDLLQETFLRLTRESLAGRAPDTIRPWLYRVASNLVVTRARQRAVAGRWLSRLVQRESAEGADAAICTPTTDERVARSRRYRGHPLHLRRTGAHHHACKATVLATAYACGSIACSEDVVNRTVTLRK